MAPLSAALDRLDRELRDPEPTLRSVVEPWVREHIRRQLATSGQHGGQPWSFSGEEQYEAAKIARYGPRFGRAPLLVPDDVARLGPSLTQPGHPDGFMRIRGHQLVLGSRLDYARRLLITGGEGPYGEPYEARDPLVMTEAQERELAQLIEEDIARRARLDLD